MQRLLFQRAGIAAVADEQESLEEMLRVEFPFFRPDVYPYWNSLLPSKPGVWTGAAALEPQEPLLRSNSSFEVELD